MKNAVIIEVTRECIASTKLIGDNLLDIPEQWPKVVFPALAKALELPEGISIVACRGGFESNSIRLKLKGDRLPAVAECECFPTVRIEGLANL